ncbi:protein lava lamp [Bactrocera dorsalis]|uniref:Protein lava lamp n=1 Tax=Bactrocera dorsalis TaxID=27457 RepID=A0ABM3JRQ7_BACDO|nr:protein lava lamp [Bactrocera dorsalis]XP_049311922.1 protein lava lamp [Bactrocera dorsalis]XP_049311923.1 protein lava lamp [Bactrocera dorsalis]
MSSSDPNEHAANISNLQESFSKQQKKISALKELVRKSEAAHGKSTSSTQAKVKNIAQCLTNLKNKARSRQSLPASNTSTVQENVTTFAPNETIEPVLEQYHHPTQQGPPQLTHSFSYVEQNVGVPSQYAQTSTPNFTPLKSQHRSDSSKSLTNSTMQGSEKVQLLRQQMEQNKLLMAQRASSKQHLEQLVSQLKEKFDTTQQCLEDTNELGKSMSDLSALMVRSPTSRERHKSATDLSSQPFSLERERIKFLENRCRLLEKQLEKERQVHGTQEATTANESKKLKELENKVVELEKSLQERQSEIENKIGETQQLAEELERTRSDVSAKDEELCLMRLKQGDTSNDFTELADLENNDIERLRSELADKHVRINELEEISDMLEANRCELTLKNNKYEEQIEQLKLELNAANEKVQIVEEELKRSEEKCASLAEVLEKLQNTTEAVVVETGKTVNITSVQVSEEMAKQIQELRDECDKLLEENSQLKKTISEQEKLEVSDTSIAEKIEALESTIESQREDLKERQAKMSRMEEEVMEKTIELNVLNANFKVLEEKLEAASKSKSLFSSIGGEAADNPALEAEIQQLKQKLDESNKAMIKLKLKCKQTEKQVEKLKKSSDLHGENVRLTALSEELQQKIIELEDEKGQWQLTQVDTAAKTSDADNAEEQETRIAEFEEKLKTQAETVRLLEEQKYEQAQKLEVAEEKLRELREQLDSRDGEETRRVKSEMSEIQLEEKLEEQTQQLQQLEERLTKTHVELEEHKQKVAELQEQKQAADKKLENYMVENMELLDKIEKLSKSSSSAESIEIVERLTQQERAEIDEYNKQQLDGTTVNSVNELTQTELAPELSDSLVKLREESSELMNKIELFTTERREVLERMEHLTAENHELIEKVEELTREKEDMETNVLLANDAKIKLEERIKELSKEKDQLAVQVAEFKVQGNQLSQELSSLQKSSEVVAALDSKDDAALIAKCEKCLTNLSHELEIYRKANDKNAKFNASKKLAKEAKNAHTQLSELLQKVKEASTAVETVTVVETVVAVTAPNGKALAEYEQLTTQNRLLKERIKELQQELQEAREADDTDTSAAPATQTAAVPALTEDQATKEQREKQLEELKQYEEQCVELQSTVENLRLQLVEARTAGEERSGEITQLNEELDALRKSSSELESLLSDKNLTHEQELKELTRLRRELEGKCDTYEGEMNILQTLVTEQKQQLIEAYKEHEHENNMKLLDLQDRDEQILQLRDEIKELKHALTAAGDQLAEDLRRECEKLREALKINKNLVTEQVNELSNKQETIEMLNQQIIDLYKTMEENANNIIDKEDEIASLQETLDSNSKELERLRKDNVEQKTVVDKLLIELHSHRATVEQVPQLESELQRLEEETKKLDTSNKELEKRNKEQLEKLKKYAANLKKRAAQCQELEAKVSQLEKGSLEAMQTKQQDTGNEELTDQIKQLENQIEELKTQIAAKTADANAATEHSERLKTQLEELERSLAEKNSEIVQLQVALVDAQEQTAGWGDSALDLAHTDSAENEELKKKLEEKTHKLQEAEAEIYSMQEELIQVRESEREKFYAIKDIQEALQHKSELVAELQKQMQSHKQADDITQTLEDKVQTFEERLQTLTEELKAKSIKFEKSKAVIKERNNQIQRLQAQLKDLQDKLSARPEEEYIGPPLNVSVSEATAAPTQAQVPKEAYDELQVAYEKLSERFAAEQSSFQATIARLETLHDGIQAKLQENMSYIETLEQDNTAYKEKICRLEEGIATFEERRASMERRTNLLCAQLQTRETEHEQAEDELLYRLNMLSEHDDVIAQRLLQAQEEKDDLQERIERMQAECSQLSNNYAKMEKEYQAYRTQNETHTAETQQLREQLTAARAELEQLRNAYDAKLAVKTTELDELESELSEQLSKMNSEKRLAAEELERAQDALRELNNNYLKMETEYRTYREQSEANSVADTQQVREQLTAAQAELEQLRGEYDAKLAVKTTQLDELESELSEQLAQMNNDKRATAEALERAQDECNAQKDEIVRLKESLNALEQTKQELEREATWLRLQNEGSQQDQYELQELRMQAMQDKTEIDNLRHQIETLAGNHEVELQALRTQISELDTLRMQVGQNQTDDQVFIETENKRLTDLLAEKEAIIENYQRQNLQLQMAAAAAAQPPAATQHDPLGLAFGVPPLGQSSASHAAPQADENARLQRELLEKSEQLARLQHELNALQSEFHSARDGNHELQRQLAAKQQEIESLRNNSYNNTPTAAAVFGQQPQQDVIPAPLFFSTEQATPSPFDEIVQVRTIDNLGSGARSHNVNNPVNTAIEQPTIEDLQRNVSDLEKHAQELENKLATRNQRELEIEERLRESQQSLSECERQLRERAEELNAARAELQQVFAANEAFKAANSVAHQELEQLRSTLAASQSELAQREQQLKQLEMRLQETRVHSDSQAATDLMGLGQLQGNLEQLQTMLQQRDDELNQLRRALEDEKTLKERTSALESQIIPDTLANLGIADAPNAVPTLDMFFGGANSGANDFEKLVIPPVSNVPVVEEMIVPEKAYVCHPQGGPTGQSQQDAVAFDLGDDFGDVWGAQEAAAEEEHFSKTAAGRLGAPVSLVPREQQLEIQLAEQAERIAELQLTVERCEQQRQELQVKSGKLMKKLKEYKTKIDELQSSAGKPAKSADASASFFDLDAAIQDELKAQIKQLENTLQEERKQHELHGAEKEKLLKRIDVLTAGSERMTEMKERQDMEVQMYQARIKELQTKVNQLEDWGPHAEAGKEATSEGQQLQQQHEAQSTATVASTHEHYAPPAPPSTWETEKQQLNQRIAELTAEIADINVDRQELQAVLDDEKANVQRAEDAQKLLQQQLSARDLDFTANESAEKTKYNELKAELHQLQEKYNTLHATCEEQTGELNRLKACEDQLNAALQQAEQNLAATSATSAQEETLKAALSKAEGNLEQANAELARLESDLTEVQSQLLELQTKNAELLQANEELRQANTLAVATQQAETSQLSTENQQLRAQNEALEQRVQVLQQDFSKQASAAVSVGSLSAAVDVDELNAQLQEKESEIMHLKQRIEDLMREDQTEKLVLEILTKNQEIHLLKMQVKNLEDDKQELEHNLAVQITSEMQAKKSDLDDESAQLRERTTQLEQQLQALQSEKHDMEEELKVLNNHVMSSLENEDKLKAAALQLDTQNIEIAELRRTIEALRANGSAAAGAPAATTPADYAALNAQWEAIVEQKCGEIAKMWREHLEQREAEFKMTEARLRDEIAAAAQRQAQSHEQGAQPGNSAETTATSTPASVSTSQSGTSSGTASKDGTPLRHRIINEEHESDADAIIEKMQAALESQEMEIVTLKEQLAIRSAEYARLAAQYDPFKLQNTSSHSGISGGMSSESRRPANTPTGNDATLVPKSELDFALYMLHQRDMRCEEMTVELVSLLEERDTLQLKLSNTLRQVEAIKAATNYIEPPNAPADNAALASPTAAASSQPRSAAAAGDSATELSQKLSQLQTVNHSKDKVIKEERDQRIRQMEKIQQDVAKMPPAAVSELVGTDAAQSGQSPSSVLLNWLWGNKPDAGGSAPH